MNIQAIFGLAVAMAICAPGEPASAGRWPAQGFLVCYVASEMVPIAWAPGANGGITLLSGTRPRGEMIEAGNVLIGAQ